MLELFRNIIPLFIPPGVFALVLVPLLIWLSKMAEWSWFWELRRGSVRESLEVMEEWLLLLEAELGRRRPWG